MDRKLRILMLEDVAADAELVQRELREANIAFSATLVDTKDTFVRALEEFDPDIILADYSLPSFDGIAALAIAAEQRPDVPFVFVSGAIGEERAIEALKNGATDYVLKDRMSRLVPSVRQAVREREERAARKRAEEALRASEQRHRVLLEVNNAIITNLDRISLLNGIVKALGEIFSMERVSLVLHDPTTDLLSVHAVTGTSDTVIPIGTEFRCQGSHLEEVFTAQQPLVRNDLEKEVRFAMEDTLLQEGIRSYVAIPLISKARAFGSLNISSRERLAYSEAEVDLLLEVGQQVSLAVENMLAYEEIAQLKSQLEQENVYLQEEIKTEHNFDEILGQSFVIRQVLDIVSTVAPTPATVLITGETGTGKELIARAVHSLSTRQNKPLIKVNCAAIPKELFESEFFGHVKGAFTGAVKDRQGRFELADGGTLFLDEVAEIPLELQSKLLRVLQEAEFERIGEERTRSVDVRIIAASNRHLEEEIQAGRFRQDLYFRLNVIPIEVPSLRERRDDIVLLANHFLTRACQRFGRHGFELTERQIEYLKQYDWPGNVRELCNIIDRAVILSKGQQLDLERVLQQAHGRSVAPTDVGSGRKFVTADEFKRIERENILAALEEAGGRISGADGAAALLCLAPSTLTYRMRKLGIAKPK